MFKLVLDSGIPLICVRYRDTINIETVITYYAGKKKVKPFDQSALDSPEPETVYWRLAEDKTTGRTAAALYDRLAKVESQMVYINLKSPPRAYFDAGDMPTPAELVENTLMDVFKNAKFVSGLMSAVGGLTLQEVVEVVKLAGQQYGSINPERLTKMRGLVMPPTSGLTMVDTFMPFYLPNAEWTTFIEHERSFFFDTVDPRLRPKGVLLDGDPGTGKTQGSKYLAAQWGIPLYRMDATLNSKWHGESESNLQSLLNQAAHEEPCALLVDEAEKIFGNNGADGSSNVKAKLLSLMLWFMQERSERVFMIFTTNNADIIPPELLREGRLDRQFDFKGLNREEGIQFMKNVCLSFEDASDMNPDALQLGIKKHIDGLYGVNSQTVVHSRLAQASMSVIKGLIKAKAQTEGAAA